VRENGSRSTDVAPYRPTAANTALRYVSLLLGTLLLGTILAACGGSSRGDSAAADGLAPGAPIKVGVLTSLTGGAAFFNTARIGVKARLALENASGGVDGHKIEYVVVDDKSTLPGAAAAAKQLVADKTFGALAVSAQFGSAAPVFKSAGMPVAGASFDGSAAWHDPSYTNLFSASGVADPDLVSTTFGRFFDSVGATKVAALAGPTPSAMGLAIGAQKSAVKQGLKAGYLNMHVGSSPNDVADIVRGIKESGSDAVYMPLNPTTAFAVVAGLKKAGVHMQSELLATGYGADLLKSPQTVAAAQGVEFTTTPAPVEIHSEATKAFTEALQKYGGSTESPPSFATYMGWLTADLFIHGLRATGPIVTQEGFIAALHSNSWSGNGLQQITDYSNPFTVAGGLGPGNCMNVVRLQGNSFVPVKAADPVCGALVPRVRTGIHTPS
jgi:ABC-type branched-subunit amino acid transport system substrate-binding protein